MNLVLFWTDKCFFLVLMTIVFLIINGLRKPPTRQAFAKVFSKPFSLSSAVVLLFFVLIGVLDSIHLKPDAHSVLDSLMYPLGVVHEKTYSAPLATQLFTAELRVKDGKTLAIYPRLKYIDPRIRSEESKWQFIRENLFKASLISATVVFFLTCFLYLSKIAQRFFSRRILIGGLCALFCCIFFISSSYLISRGLHFLGTGKIGQDIFYTTVKSIRTGLMIGILTTLFMMPLALLLGIMAGYFGGFVDDIIQYIYTTLSSIPGVLLISASVLSMQTYIANHPDQFSTLEESADARLLALCLILGITSWTSLCRLLRAETMMLKEIDYVIAAKALGSSAYKIIFKHLLPNVMHIVIITFVLDFSFLVLAEAVLSYVGVGVSPLTMSWGNMINAARLELARLPVVWWPMFAAFLFMFTLVLSSNLFADAVEHAFNPREND